MPSRRPSTQYPKAVDPRLANNTNYSTDDRTLGPSYDSYYNQNQDSWTASNTQQQMQDPQRPYSQTDQSGVYGPSGGQQAPPSSYRGMNRQDLPHQQSIDQSSQQFSNQGRRLSSTIRPGMNQRPAQQEWNQPQPMPRRQSVLAQPTYDTQTNTYVDGGTAAYGRNEFRSGTVASEATVALDRQQMMDSQGYVQSGPQAYRQTNDPQAYRQPQDQQMYRQAPHEQAYRQPAAAEMDAINGARAPGARPSIDYFDHYKRPPSRDSSVDRYGRRSRQPSVEATPGPGVGATAGAASRAGSVAPPAAAPASRPASRAATPAAGNGHLASGRGSISRAASREPQPFEESLMRKRTLGQDISPSPYQPKRTESLFVAQNQTPAPAPKPMGGGGGGGGGRKVRCCLVFPKLDILMGSCCY